MLFQYAFVNKTCLILQLYFYVKVCTFLCS